MGTIPQQIGKYRIIREIGRGATAIVYLAESPDHEEPVAVKYVHLKDQGKGPGRDEAKWNRRLLKLLKAEGAVAERLHHPHIIRVFEAVIKPEETYVVMEYFPGDSLEQYCRFENLLPLHRIIGIVFKCCMALDYAYRQGIVHRDIKPANILVDVNDNDNVKITDFGLALNLNKKIDADSTFIMGVGSPAYMSPEQIRNYPLNQKTDLYSLGVVLFHLLTGRLPFRANNPAQLIYKIINADPPSVLKVNPNLPEMLDKVIRKALEKDLYSRYKNGAEFATDLSSVRYKIVDDKFVPLDTTKFSILRGMHFFNGFEDVEIWEVLRISTWHKIDSSTVLFHEEDTEVRFGIILEGEVQLVVDNHKIMTLGSGEVIGESAWMDNIDHRQTSTAISTGPLSYLEINPSALSLATDEVQALFQRALSTVAAKRLGETMKALAQYSEEIELQDVRSENDPSWQLMND